MSKDQLSLLSQKLIPEIDFPTAPLSRNQFIEYLKPLISELLEKDFARLLQIMYRIDVSEKEFALTLQPNLEKDIPAEIAELVYKRLLIKIKYREKYKQ
jgi:hypothetical protein